MFPVDAGLVALLPHHKYEANPGPGTAPAVLPEY